MLAYSARRIAAIVPTLFVIVTVAFFVIRLAPGGPFDAEQSVSSAVRANLEAVYGLDRPLLEQYMLYVRRLAAADLGTSFSFRNTPVRELLSQGLPVSLSLGALAILFAIGAGVPLGCVAALRRNRLADRAVLVASAIAIALPAFVVGPLVAFAVGLQLGWFPVAGWKKNDPAYLVLPVFTLALPVAAHLARLTRGSMAEVLQLGFIRTARAKGMPRRRILLHHALRPALLPVASYLGPATAFVLTGSLVVETVFGLPGSGRYLVQGAINRDYPLVMGMVVVYGVATLLSNLIADLVYGWLDPRARHG